MSSELAIHGRNLGKAYRIYDRPVDRLKQMLWRGKKNYYREFWALRGVDFDINRGETVGIVGANGAGKSTLLQLICGTISPSEGELQVNGRVAALLSLGAAFNPEFTGRENVFVNAAVLGLTEDQIRERFDRIAAFADIGNFIDQPVRTYSSGMYARLAFAVAIHVDPEILIVDEILAVGDAAFQRKCVERFYEIRDSGCTILFVSHDPYQVKSLCSRAIYLNHGERRAFGKADEVIDRYTIDMEAAIAKSRKPETHSAVHTLADAVAPASPFRITDVYLEDDDGNELSEVESGQNIRVRFRYIAQVPDFPKRVSFVVNFYRHDDFYVCGTTTLMEGLEPFEASAAGEVVIRFPNFRMLAGEYKWRVAINDDVGLIIYADAKHVCAFRVIDRFRAVGLIDLPREWRVRALPSDRPQVLVENRG
ncbi:MAG: ABC transporter ATP-binding protein [Phycisphaerae bacterium]